MKQKTGHPAIDQGISVFMETKLYWRGIEIRVYDLEREGYPLATFLISWHGILKSFTNRLTVFAGMTMEDLIAFYETGDKPLGYDG